MAGNDYPERLRRCRLFLLDMDGTLYLGDEVLPGAVEFIRDLEEKGRRFIYLTNNSSRAGADYVPRLRRLGFPCAPENVLTSGMAAARYLNENYPGARVCLVGTRALARELVSAGITLDDERADVVLAGFDTELCYRKLERAVHFLRRGAVFIAANPDLVCPMPRGEVLPDCGSICALLEKASGAAPRYIGKPERRLIDLASELTGIPNSEICCVGDRLYTDIACAKNAGAVSALVLSGETTPEMLESARVVPDYVFPGVRELGQSL